MMKAHGLGREIYIKSVRHFTLLASVDTLNDENAWAMEEREMGCAFKIAGVTETKNQAMQIKKWLE